MIALPHRRRWHAAGAFGVRRSAFGVRRRDPLLHAVAGRASPRGPGWQRGRNVIRYCTLSGRAPARSGMARLRGLFLLPPCKIADGRISAVSGFTGPATPDRAGARPGALTCCANPPLFGLHFQRDRVGIGTAASSRSLYFRSDLREFEDEVEYEYD